MSKIKAPFTDEQVKNLNEYQKLGIIHPFTCANDGDKSHIDYEFQIAHPGEDYEAYFEKEKEKGVPFPEMAFNQTNLIATNNGWSCPVCDYKQDWAHEFMTDVQKIKDNWNSFPFGKMQKI